MDSNGRAKALTKCGTQGYTAPDIDNSLQITRSIDTRAFGIILNELSTAHKPTGVRKFSYGPGPLPFESRDWRKGSKYLRDLLECYLKLNPKAIISASEVLQHPWFSKDTNCN